MTALRLLRLLLRGTAVVAAIILVLLGAAWAVGRVLIARAEPEALVGLAEHVPGTQVTVDGRSIHVVERGEGPPVLLVHGFAGSTYDWEEHLLEPLSTDHRAIAVDLLGMGWSARDGALPYGFDLWVEQLGTTLHALGIERVRLAGHSLGGAVAAIFAARHPEQVERLILVAPLVPYDVDASLDFFAAIKTPGVGELVLGWVDHLPSLPGFSDAYHARAHDVFRLQGTRDALLRYVRHGADWPALEQALRTLAVPTVFVLGTTDQTVPYQAQIRAATLVHESLVLPVPGAGHWLLRDAPDRVAEGIRVDPSAER